MPALIEPPKDMWVAFLAYAGLLCLTMGGGILGGVGGFLLALGFWFVMAAFHAMLDP